MKKLYTPFLVALFGLLAYSALASTITIQQGDTLGGLAKKYNTSVKSLAEVNGIENPDYIVAGEKLEIPEQSLGATIPVVIATYVDSLASRISSSASSFTLVRGTDKQSRALSGFYGFVIDEGTSVEEFLTANCTATACTIVGRGIDVQDGSTQVTALKQEHRRGATVKITNFPQLAILSRILNGQESASSTFMFGDGTNGANKVLKAYNADASKPFLQYNETSDCWQYSDNGVSTVCISAGAAGGLTASTTKGIFVTDSKIGINASSTGGLSFDGSYNLYFNGVVNTSTIHNASVTLNGNNTFVGNTTSTGTFAVPTPVSANQATPKTYVDTLISAVATSTNIQSFTSNGTWTKPTGSKVVDVLCIGGGGGGGTADTSDGGSGGGGGASVRKRFSAASLGFTVSVTVPSAAAAGAVGGNVSFGTHVVAYGGGAGGRSGTGTSGGGGGGSISEGENGGGSATHGGSPYTTTDLVGIGGGGGGGSVTAAGKGAEYGGAAGGASLSSAAGAAGGASIWGAGGGGGGADAAANNGAAGGASNGVSGGAAGNAANPTGGSGTNGTDGGGGFAGSGGGGGGGSTGTGGNGGNGGAWGGGGGGGGKGNSVGGTGGTGGAGGCLVTTIF